MRSGSESLKKAQKAGLCLLLALTIAFGAWVELRGAFLKTRRTDIGPYLRAAWAVRTGESLYKITDERGWHYVYPPLLAVVMTPLADPPSGADRSGYVPYAASVGIWYALTLAMGFLGVHVLAKALEETSGNPALRGQPAFCRRWWALRITPILILLPAIGRSQMRGQVGLLIAFLLCSAAASLVRGKRFSAGIWLAAALCIKIIPAFLLLLPAWRRDRRMLSGSLAGAILGLIVIPLLALGPQRTIEAYRALSYEVIGAGITGNAEGSLGRELTGITSTDSNSPMVVIHNIMYPDKHQRPKAAAPGVRLTHWIIVSLLTVVTFLAAGPGNTVSSPAEAIAEGRRNALFLGALTPVMMIASPVFHPHYVSMLIPAVAVLLSTVWDRHAYPHIPGLWKALFGALFISHALTSVDLGPMLYLRDFGLVLFTTLLLWAGCAYLLRAPAGDVRPYRFYERRRGIADYEIRSIAVVLPVFNERNTISAAVGAAAAFADKNPRYSFLFVDDGSYDGTAEILRNAVSGSKNISFLSYGHNRGKGHAVRVGFESVQADALCFIDSDMAYALDYLKLIEEKLKTSDLVIGSRRLPHVRRSGNPLRRRILGELFNRLARTILDLPFRDTQAGLKGFRLNAARHIFRKCSIEGFGFDAEILFLARKSRFRVAEIAASESERHSYKKGKLKLLKDSLVMFCNLLHIRWKSRAGGYG